jgi:hypothetical protein
MAFLHGRRRPRSYVVITLVGLLAALVQPARAADATQVAGSLRWIPADAAYYSASLHSREQWNAIQQSRAWTKLKALPLVQTARQKIEAEWKEDGQLAPLYQFYQQPENRQLVEMLGDMFSEEIFLYGGPSWVGFLDLAGQLNAAQSYGPVLMLLSGQAEEKNAGKMQVTMLLRTLANNLSLVRVPDQIIGFKLTDTKRAQAQLKRLETVLTNLQTQFPPLQGRVRKVKLAGGSFLTLTLDGTMVPWQLLPIKNYEVKEGEFDELMKKLGQLRLTFAIGICDGYLLISLGESTSLLKSLGGDKQLSERPELKPLAAYAGKRITSLSYASAALRAVSQTSQWDALIKLISTNLPHLDLNPETRTRLLKDLSELAEQTRTAAAQVGASFSLSFSSARGSEGYAYDYGQHPTLDGSKALTLLSHVGGSPVFAMVARSRQSSESYEQAVKALQIAYQYFEQLAVPRFDADTREKFNQLAKVVRPAVERLHHVTATMLLPALADGQIALVVDAGLKSPQWLAMLPPTGKPLPIVEPALVLGVSDAKLLRKAFAEYRSIVNKLIPKLHEVAPHFPDRQIPEPQTRNVKAGTLYFYPLPAEWGIDRQIAPTAGISNRVAVLAISPKHAERLLAAAPLKVEGGPLADVKKRRAMATYFHWAAVIQAVTPWVEQGLCVAGIDSSEKVEVGDESWKGVLKQVPAILQLLRVFRSYASSSYFEGPVLVTHSEMVIEDL